MRGNIIVAADFGDGGIRPVTFELIAFARKLSRLTGDPVQVVVAGEETEAVAGEIAEKEGLDVLAVTVSSPGPLTGEGLLFAWEQILKALNVSSLLFSHTPTGMGLAPALAVDLNAACITGVNGLVAGEVPLFSRSICNGKFNARMKVGSPAVLTLMPGSFRGDADSVARAGGGQVSRVAVPAAQDRVSFRGRREKESGESPLSNAKIVIAAGRGIGERENLEKIYRFSRLFPSAAVAASRPLIDMGWLPYRQQVGITGACVAPEIYIACGISGSSQHLAGMDRSGYVIAINNDPNAAIFNHADLCIVEDLVLFIDALRRQQ